LAGHARPWCAGERALVEQLTGENPPNVAVTVVDLGCSTYRRNGGVYPSQWRRARDDPGSCGEP
jgi:hypothetical protein